MVAAILGVDLPPVEESVQAVSAAAGCSARPKRTRVSAGVTRQEWRGCAGGVDVDLVTLDGVGHEWPTGRPIDTTLEVLRFFDIAP